MKNKKRKILIVVVAIALLLGVTYAWMVITKNSSVVNKITAGSLDLILDESTTDGIHLENAVPMSYQQGLTTTPYTFKLKNNSNIAVDYYLSLDDFYDGMTIPPEGKISDSKIRYILLKDEEEANAINSKLLGNSRIIKSGTISKNEEINFTLYLWIDSKAGVEVNNQVFSAKLNIEANQSTSAGIKLLSGNGTNVGDIVSYNDEKYFVTNYNSATDTITLIPEYNLKQIGNTFKQDSNDTGYSSTNGVVWDAANNRTDSYCTAPEMGCNIYEKNDLVTKDSTIKGIVTEYKNYLISTKMIDSNDTVRLISLDELEALGYNLGERNAPVTENTAPYFMYTSTYWTGEAKSNSTWDVWFMYKDGELSYNNASAARTGFRPVIDIKKSKLSNNSKLKSVYSTWVWSESVNSILSSEENMNKSISLLKNVGVNEVYLSIMPEDLENTNEKEYFKKLYSNGIKAYVLYGDPVFVLESNYNSVVDYNMTKVKEFNDHNLGSAHIEGIHYDVEYYAGKYDGINSCPYGESEENKNCEARKFFVNFVKRAYNKSRELNLKTQYDVTVQGTNFTTYNDGTTDKNVLDEIIDYVDDLVIMSYGNGTRNSLYPVLFTGNYQYENSSINVDESMLEKLKNKNKNIIIGQELEIFKNTAKELEDDPTLGPIYLPEYEENGHTRYKYTWSFVSSVFDDITNKIYEEGSIKPGISIHDYKQLEGLYN